MTDDLRWMRLAIALGERGLGRVWPNPAVGCVIVAGARVHGRGWTRDGGRPHAETVALAQAGRAARGATAYVSLEPCAHHGATPPCAEALVAAGVARVVTAIEDPDPRVAGRGHAILRTAGVEVVTGVLEAEARRAQAGYLTRVTRGRPLLTLKLATSLDGRIATASGESRWITGPQARRCVHAMRARHDAVLIGAGTARADDPDLSVRGLGVTRQPVRLVASRGLELASESRLGRTAREVPVWLLHGPEPDPSRRAAWEAAGARLIEVPADGAGAGRDGAGRDGAGLDPAAMLAALGREGLTRVFCEGGGALAAALLGAGLVDRLALFTGGLALGAEGRPGLGALAPSALAEAPRFLLRETRSLGPDALQLWEAE